MEERPKLYDRNLAVSKKKFLYEGWLNAKKINNSLEYQRLLSRYPKKRIRLNNEYKKIYNEHYMLNRDGEGITNMLSQKMESWMHKKVSKVSATNILEIGAGNLNHIDYETNFTNYDIVEPFKELYINNPLKKK